MRSPLNLVGAIIALLAVIVAALIGIGLTFELLDLDPSNGVLDAVVSAFRSVGDFLTSPFQGLFELDDRDQTTLLNWALAAIVYLVVGSFIANRLRAIGS
ncbi:MAG: hypothetical protein ACR2NA_14350 [Solirubrobacterales bacterium]